MKEKLLQFIWQMQYFNRGGLSTTKNEPIEIISHGIWNKNQGPDFTDARIRIGGTTWAGSVELHLLTSGWEQHKHSEDRNFNNVILHVVWEDDREAHELPLLELKDRVPKFLLQRYEQLMKGPVFIPCENLVALVDPLVIMHWKDRLLAERVGRKAETILSMQEQSRKNWQEVYWWLLARNFGHAVNSEAFEAIARSLPLSLISKHAGSIQQLEALLLGQADILTETFTEHYPIMLQKEYQFLKRKYGLTPIAHNVHFLRMRPANFPTVRLAQLAMLVHLGGHSLHHVINETGLAGLKDIFEISPNDYWQTHYLPGRPTVFREKKLGDNMFSNILVNSIVPFLFAYGKYHAQDHFRQRALDWLNQLPSESNTIIRGFENLGIPSAHAADGQALLELKSRYCDLKNCLDCNIGNSLLSRVPGS